VRPPEPPSWRWSQQWRDLFFAHWQVREDALRSLLPAGVEPDTWNGSAWVTAVAFRLERVRLRRFPALASLGSFHELNLRTYVRCGGESAIYFFSIHASSRLAVALARWLTPLPYAYVRIDCDRSEHNWHFQTPLFRADIELTSEPHHVKDNSLDAWLLERYLALTGGVRGRLYRMAAQHPRWQVQSVRPRVTAAALGEPWQLDLGGPPDLCHFAPGVDALVGPFEVVTRPVFFE
jgi:uncharacterized protein YqjF (DUF2071 family)